QMQSVSAWPKWFWPGVAAALVIGVLVFSLRLLLRANSSQVPQANTFAASASDQSAVESYASSQPTDTRVSSNPSPDATVQTPASAPVTADNPADDEKNHAALPSTPAAEQPTAKVEQPADEPSSTPTMPTIKAQAEDEKPAVNNFSNNPSSN